MAKQNPTRKPAPRRDNSFIERFRRQSFSEKVMFILSLLIVVAMVLGLFVSFIPSALG